MILPHFNHSSCYRIFLQENDYAEYPWPNRKDVQRRTCLLQLLIKTRTCRWCNCQHQVGAACGLCYHELAKLTLWPRDQHGAGWRAPWMFGIAGLGLLMSLTGSRAPWCSMVWQSAEVHLVYTPIKKKKLFILFILEWVLLCFLRSHQADYW